MPGNSGVERIWKRSFSRGGGRGWDKEYEQEDYVLKKQGTFSSKIRKDTGINEGGKEDSGLCESLSF